MAPKSRTKNSRYDVKDLEKAVDAVKSGQLSYRKAARNYNIPKTTIREHVTRLMKPGAKPGRATALPSQVETSLAQQITKAAETGFGINRMQLAAKAAQVARRLQLQTPWKDGVPGKDWLKSFRERQNLSLRRPLALATVRARMLNRPVVNSYFEDLKKLLNDLDLMQKPHHIWNMDETSVPLTHKPTRVITASVAKNTPARVGNNRENLTVLPCINAAGTAIPPMVIAKGKTPQALNAYNTAEGVPGTKYTYQERAWMEDILGQIWFREHFVKCCGPERPQVLILDSHSSHETLGLLEAAKKEGIHLFAFPPHTTQWLCPLDKTINSPLDRAFNRVCSEFMSRISEQHGRQENIKAGFTACGIYPLDQSAIPESAYAPSDPFDTHLPNKATASALAPITPVVASATIVEPMQGSVPGEMSTPTPARSTISRRSKTTTNKRAAASQASMPASATVPEEQMCSLTATSMTIDARFLIEALKHGDIAISQVGDRYEIQVPEFDMPMDQNSIDVSPGKGTKNEMEVATQDASVTYQEIIEEVFDLPQPNTPAQPNKNRRKLTSHRLLTSNEIIAEKRKRRAEKEKEAIEKEERKQKRMEKKAQRNEAKQAIGKKQNKKKSCKDVN